MSHPSNAQPSPTRGVLLFASALLLFAGMDTIIKYLTTHYNVPMIVAIRYIVHCLLMVAILAPSHGWQLVQTQRPKLVVLRAIALAVVSVFIGLALQRMPVAETTAINFLSPLVVVLLAGTLLGERTSAIGWAAAVAGFAGVLLIARPGSGLDATGVLYAFCAVGASSIYQLLSRHLASTERTITLLFHTALVGSVCFGAFLPWYWEGGIPSLQEAVIFLSMGAIGGLGHYLFTAAYRHTPASLLAPMSYLQLLWAGLLGWLVFGHIPDPLSILGMCVVAVAGAMVAINAHNVKTKRKLCDLSQNSVATTRQSVP